MDSPWQAILVKVGAGLGCAAILFVAFGLALTASDPRGSDSGSGTLGPAAVWLVRAAATVVMLLLLGFLCEVDALSDRLPRLSWRVAVATVPVLVFLLPVLNLGFHVAVFVIVLVVLLVFFPTPLLRLRVAALFDAAVCICMSGTMLGAGPTGDYGVARVLVGLYAGCGGALLPGLALLASFVYAPRTAWASVAAYALAALHGAAIALQAVGNLVYSAIGTPPAKWPSVTCIPVVPSPLGLLLGWLGSAANGHPYKGGKGCVGPAKGGGGGGVLPCDPIEFWVMALGFAAGAWACWGVAFLTCWPQQVARVQPMPMPMETTSMRATMSGKLSNLGMSRPQRSIARKVALAVFVLTAGSIVGLGYLVFYKCPSDRPAEVAAFLPSNMTNGSTSTSRTTKPPKKNTNTSTTTTSTLTTSTTSTTTTTTSTTSMTTTTSRTSTSTLTRTSRPNTTNSSNSSRNNSWWPIDVPGGGEDNSTNDSTSNGTNASVWYCPDEPADVGVVGPPSLLRPGCSCWEIGSRGMGAWIAVPTEQMSLIWCDLGDWAGAIVGLFLYFCHTLAGSLVLAQARGYSDTAREREERVEVDILRREIAFSGRSFAEAVAEKNKSDVVLWKEAPKDPLPEPSAQVGLSRVYVC